MSPMSPPAHASACVGTHTYVHKHITKLMSDLPHVDSVMGCGLEHSNRTSGQVGQHKDPLVAVCPSLSAPGTFVCHVLLCDNKSPHVFFLYHPLILCLQCELIVTFLLDALSVILKKFDTFLRIILFSADEKEPINEQHKTPR